MRAPCRGGLEYIGLAIACKHLAVMTGSKGMADEWMPMSVGTTTKFNSFPQNPTVLSGQDISKGRIKAAAHAKDGDCFGCLIIPLNTAYYLTTK